MYQNPIGDKRKRTRWSNSRCVLLLLTRAHEFLNLEPVTQFFVCQWKIFSHSVDLNRSVANSYARSRLWNIESVIDYEHISKFAHSKMMTPDEGFSLKQCNVNSSILAASLPVTDFNHRNAARDDSTLRLCCINE